MMEGVLAWIANDMTYDKFWRVYVDLKNLHHDISVFMDIIKGYLSADDDNFMEHTIEICHSQDRNTITFVVDLLFRIHDIKVLSLMEDLVDSATKNNETPAAITSNTVTNSYLQTIVSSTVTFIDNYLNYCDSCNEFNKLRCKLALQNAASVCTNLETFRKITSISLDTNIQLSSCWNFTTQSIKDLNWERVKQLTSPITSYDAIKYFTENAGTGIHPCVVVEIVLKWWSVRKDRRTC